MSTPTPHDALFKATFSDLGRAAEVLRQVLPAEVTVLIDFSTLALEDGTFIDEDLRDRHVDRLYSAKMAGRPSLIYVLYEHNSTDDRWSRGSTSRGCGSCPRPYAPRSRPLTPRRSSAGARSCSTLVPSQTCLSRGEGRPRSR